LEKELRLTEEEEHELLAAFADLEREEQLQTQQAQEIDHAYEQFIEKQSQYIDFSKRFYAKLSNTRKQLEIFDKQLEKSEKWLSKQDSFYYLGGTFYDNHHHKPVDVRTPHFFTTSYETGVKKEEVMKQYKKGVVQLFDDFDIEKKVNELKQSAKKLEENGIDLPTPKPTFMQKLKGEYIHSFDTLDDFTTNMKPFFDEYRAELHAEKEERKKLEEKKNAEKLKKRIEADKRKEAEEYQLELIRRQEASELVKQQRLAAQMQPGKEKNLKNENDNNDYGPSL